ncbi:hypothetical protein ACPA9J_21245 [Pseudomonas aeruginosa]
MVLVGHSERRLILGEVTRL